jgi:hypothetical protein
LPFSYVQYQGDGINSIFTVPFEYLDKSHVSATVLGVPTSFTWLGTSAIKIQPAPTGLVEIKRTTPKDAPPVDFSDGSVLKEKDLDLLALFSLYCAQEAQDSSDKAIAQSSLGIDLAKVYQGARTSNPTIRTNGQPLQIGDLYFNSVANTMRVYTGLLWQDVGVTVPGILNKPTTPVIAAAGQTSVPVPGGFDPAGIVVFVNGTEVNPPDVTLTSGTNIVFTAPFTGGEEVTWLAFGVFQVVDLALPSGSSKVWFQQAGTGASVRNLQDRGRETISVKDFGAVGDGVADDTAAIQGAINYASIFTRGATPFLPAGRYKITSTITLEYNRAGLKGDGATIVTGNQAAADYPWFYITHSDDAVFPSYSVLEIEGLRIESTMPLLGFAFKVVGKGIDKFAAHVKFRNLDIQGFYSAWEYGDYAFAPIISACAISGCNQVLRSKGTVAAGAHYVIEKCLVTEVGNPVGNIPIFDLGGVQTYKLIANDIEAAKSTIMTSSGADVYLYGNHFEVDIGETQTPLFILDNTDYGHFAFMHCTLFIWMSTATDVPFYTTADRKAAFVLTDCRIIVNNGITLTDSTFLTNHYHPFLANKAITIKSMLNPKSGQALVCTGPSNNALTNWTFQRALTEDFTPGGVGDPPAVVTGGAPYGGNSVSIPRSRYLATGMISVPDAAQSATIAHWGKPTFYSSGQMSLEVRLFNANKVQTNLFVVNVTGGAVGTWQRWQIDTLRNLSDSGTKYISLTYSAPDGVAYELAYPFVDFA